VIAAGSRALIASAAGTRISLFFSEPTPTAQTTGSSRSARTPAHLLGVQCKVVAEHAGGLLRRDLGHHRHVVEDGGNVVEQCKQTGAGHGYVIIFRAAAHLHQSK
jgi:hypothetical protein